MSALIRSVTYTNTDTANPTSGDRVVRYVVTDGDGGTSATFDTTVQFIAVNDAPQITLQASQSVNEDTDLVFSLANGNAISIDDIDSGSSDISTTITVTDGVFTLGGTGGLASATGNGTGSVTLQGSSAAIVAALEGSSFTPELHYNCLLYTSPSPRDS